MCSRDIDRQYYRQLAPHPAGPHAGGVFFFWHKRLLYREPAGSPIIKVSTEHLLHKTGHTETIRSVAF
jgi:hypothetical protein